MIEVEKLRKLKGRRIYLFWLDEKTGDITDVTSRDDVVHVIMCKDCKFAKLIDKENDWYECQHDKRVLHSDGYCSWAERKDI